MFGSVGILPTLGLLGSSFGGGGMFGLGFTLLSGLLGSVVKPAHPHPGFANEVSNPGFRSAFGSGQFGTLSGGPSAQTVGSMNHYFGNAYSQNGFPHMPATSAGLYQAQAGYHFGNQGVQYSPVPSAGFQQGYGHSLTHLQFGGDLSVYQQGYQQMGGHYPAYQPAFQAGQMMAHYGGVLSPYQQGMAPMMGGYGVGMPQNYNQAAMLYGHQGGAMNLTYAPTYVFQVQAQPGAPAEAKSTAEPKAATPQPVAQKPTVRIDPKPTESAPVVSKPAAKVEPKPSPTPAPSPIVRTAPPQTSWTLVPRSMMSSSLNASAAMVADRITDGEAGHLVFRGQDPRTNADGHRPERTAAWQVFQQNETLRLDAKSGYFYETRPDGSKLNRFHQSAVADIARQGGGDWAVSERLIGSFLEQRGLLADSVRRDFPSPTQTARTATPTRAQMMLDAATQGRAQFG